MKIEFKSIFIKTFLLLLACSFILFGIINFFTGTGDMNILKINDKRISINNFSRFLTEKRNQIFNADLSNEQIDYLNSKDFINITLKEFISNALIEEEIKKLNLQEPNKIIVEEIYTSDTFKNEDGKFDLNNFKNFLSYYGMSEQKYIEMLSFYNSKNNLLNILVSQNINNNFIENKIFERDNKYIIADIIEINPKNISFISKKITDEEVEKYYNENKENFKIPETTIISYTDIDLSKFNLEEGKQELSNLEDLILTSSNIDQITDKYKTKKEVINYNVLNKKLPEDFNREILEYSSGTFSELIYKDNNIYRIYFVEEIVPEKYLTLAESKNNILKTIKENQKKSNETESINKMYKQLQTNNINKVVLRNNLKLNSNVVLYKDNTKYSKEFIENLYKNIDKTKSVLKPILDNEKNVYLVGYIKNVKNISENNTNFVLKSTINNNWNISYNNSIIDLFDKYLFLTNKIVVNNKLLNNIE